MAIEKHSSKTDVVVKLILVFFISLLSFSIGTFVGKKFSDNQHTLASLEPGSQEVDEPTLAERGIASISPDATAVNPGDALTDDEIAKLAEEFITDDDGAAPTSREVAQEADTETEPTPVAETPTAPAPTPAKSAAPEKAASPAHDKVLKQAYDHIEGKAPPKPQTKPDERRPTALPKDVAGSAIGKYTVQVASYASEKEAQSMATNLKQKGLEAFYVPASVNGKQWYRVSVGLFTTLSEAKSYTDEVKAKAKVSSPLVQRITE